MNGGFVGPGVLVDVVRRPVGSDGAFVGEAARRAAGVVFHYVVLDKRAGRPAVHCEGAAGSRVVSAGEGDGPI